MASSCGAAGLAISPPDAEFLEQEPGAELLENRVSAPAEQNTECRSAVAGPSGVFPTYLSQVPRGCDRPLKARHTDGDVSGTSHVIGTNDEGGEITVIETQARRADASRALARQSGRHIETRNARLMIGARSGWATPATSAAAQSQIGFHGAGTSSDHS